MKRWTGKGRTKKILIWSTNATVRVTVLWVHYQIKMLKLTKNLLQFISFFVQDIQTWCTNLLIVIDWLRENSSLWRLWERVAVTNTRWDPLPGAKGRWCMLVEREGPNYMYYSWGTNLRWAMAASTLVSCTPGWMKVTILWVGDHRGSW